MEITASDLKALADKQEAFSKAHTEVAKFMETAMAEAEANKKLSTETKGRLDELAEKANALAEKSLQFEQKLSAQQEDHANAEKTLGELFTEVDGFEDLQKGRSKMASMDAKAIVNASGQNQPLVPSQRLAGIINQPNRPLTIRDLLPVGRTTSNLVEYVRELVFTNNAGPQYASPARELVTKPESNITFELQNAPIVTLAHWIRASKQVLDDAPQLQSYINGRLVYGLKLEEEREILNGDGTTGKLSGILKTGNFTAYTRARTGDRKLETLRRAITQGQISEYPMDAFVLNPIDWEEIELTRTTGTASSGEYVWADPTNMAGPRLWGKRVVATNAIAAGRFLVGGFEMGAQLWDREQANVRVSLEDQDNFIKNGVTILAEERLGLAIYRPQAFISGTY